jgi:hypothetical protein
MYYVHQKSRLSHFKALYIVLCNARIGCLYLAMREYGYQINFVVSVVTGCILQWVKLAT